MKNVRKLNLKIHINLTQKLRTLTLTITLVLLGTNKANLVDKLEQALPSRMTLVRVRNIDDPISVDSVES